ncbi:MAG: protein kinase [Isosphaeraceae bacterium]
MKISECPPPEKLAAFATGALSEPELTEIAAHLDSCSTCEERAGRLDTPSDPVLRELRCLDGGPGGTSEPTETFCTDRLAPALHSLERWGEFQIVRELGRGGMGVVYEAYQGSLNRHVALKVLAERGHPERFRREARAAGRLHHTNIVPVFGVGEHEGRPYYVMQYIAGQGLDAVLRGHAADGGPCDDREAARIGVQVAEALDYAHGQGVIHRDIKPSNILLDRQGTVWVTDFGLAQDSSDTRSLTTTGDFIGTLRYAAPERLSGKGDARSDLYGLGVTLYEMICGRPAFEAGDRAAVIHRVLHQEPPAPREVRPGISRDLETIVLRAMAREPGQRYATAGAMAEDLRRFLEDRPILARRARPWERAARWARRNPLLAGATLLSALALVASAAVSVAYALQQSRIADYAREQSRAASRELELRSASDSLRNTSETLLSRVALKEGISRCEHSEVGYGLLWFARALESAPEDQPELQREIRLNIDRWIRAAPGLRYGHAFPKPVTTVAISQDGARAIAGSEDGTVLLWDVATGRPVAPPMRHGAAVTAVAFSQDGKLALTASLDYRARRWHVETGAEAGPALEHGGPITSAALSPDGRHFVTAGPNRLPRLWYLSNGRSVELGRLPREIPPGKWVINWLVRFAPDGTRLIATCIDMARKRPAVSRLWTVPAGEPIGEEITHDSPTVWGWTFDREGGRAVSIGEGSAWLWDARTGKTKAGPFRHLDGAFSAAFSPDGRSFAVGCGDGTISVWDPAILDRRLAMLVHPERCNIDVVCYREDGRRLLTAGRDGVARLWDPARGVPLGGPCLHPGPLRAAAMDPRGRWILTGGDDGVARVWETPTSVTLVPTMNRANWGIQSLAFSPDGTRLATGNHDGDVVLWDTEIGVEIGASSKTPGRIVAVAFGPDGRLFATAGLRQAVGIYDGRTGAPIRELVGTTGATSLAFRPVGGGLLIGGEDGTARLWDIESGRPRGPELRHGAPIRCAAIRADGCVAVTAGDDGRALIWDLDRGVRQGFLSHQNGSQILDIALSPQGESLLVGLSDEKAVLWDLAARRSIREFAIGKAGNAVAISPDGRTVAAGGGDRRFSLWDARSGELLDRRSERRSGIVHDIAYRPDGTAVAIGLGDGTIDYLDVPYPAGGTLEELSLRCKLASNAKLDPQGNLVTLDHAEWSRARDTLAEIRGRAAKAR